MKKILLCLLVAMPLAVLFTSCEKNGEKEETDETPLKEDKTVYISEDGTTSNGATFVSIDNNNFYLNHIKYTIDDDHLTISGYDEVKFGGYAKLFSPISYKENIYEVKSIGEKAFQNCVSLTSISIPESVTRIESHAFYGCKNLKSIPSFDGVRYISDYAFLGCESLEKLILSTSIYYIGEGAFFGCDGLKSIFIPEGVYSIGKSAFSRCNSVESITVDKKNDVYDSRNDCNAIIETASKTIISGCQNTIIPDAITSIGDEAFYGCSNLTSITIPESVTSFGNMAFSDCINLTDISIPMSVTNIGNGAFGGCTGLKTITLPEGLERINISTFQYCSNLYNITIPKTVKSIAEYAFCDCSSLVSVHCQSIQPPVLSTFPPSFEESAYQNVTLYVPQQSLNAYKTAKKWSDFQHIKGE